MKKEVSDLRGESATESRTKKISNTIVQSNPNGINKNKNLPGIIQTVPFSLTKKKSKKKKKNLILKLHRFSLILKSQINESLFPFI